LKKQVYKKVYLTQRKNSIPVGLNVSMRLYEYAPSIFRRMLVIIEAFSHRDAYLIANQARLLAFYCKDLQQIITEQIQFLIIELL